jgi:tetratricopeptide (TPR) repeat protein
MAFGFGFNKQKVLNTAEKYVQQGKLPNAISEYEKILKNDAKDLTVTNTVGDLYSRLGEANKATECFKIVGDAYATQGFTVKAIAMYKKISKLKPSLESVLKLAELYTQQGLFNDARAQYLQVAEEFLKTGDLENAVRIFQKILEMDPENTTMRVRLAEVYIRLGKKNDAWQIFTAAAEALRSKGSLSGADEILQRMLSLDPGNSYALLMQGRNLIEAGNSQAAIVSLEKVADLDSNPEGLRDLLKAYLSAGRLSDAGTLAGKLLSVHNDLAAISNFAEALMQAGQYENALQVYDQHSERLLAANSEKVLQNLHTIIGHVRENPASLEKLLALFHKAGDTSHTTEVIELLAHACVQSGDLPRARDLYQKLATLEPGNPLHLKNFQQMVSQLGGDPGAKLITSEEAAVIVDELEATAPSIHQHYSDAVALAVRSALTDAELFISYNMPAKALGPLAATLPQAPHDQRLNQRLAALHTRAGRFAEAAVCCRTLQNIYSEGGYPDEATRYGELADRYEERSAAPEPSLAEQDASPGQSTGDLAIAAAGSAPWPAAASHAVAETSSAAEEDEITLVEESPEDALPAAPAPAEIDLSSEWEDATSVDTNATVEEAPEVEITDVVGDHEVPAGKADEAIEEIRFYMEHGMPEQAWAALAKLQTRSHDEAEVAAIRAELEAISQLPSTPEETSVAEPAAELAVEEPEMQALVEEIPAAAVQSPVAAEPAPVAEAPTADAEISPAPAAEPAVPQPEPAVLNRFVADLESSLGEAFLPGTVAREVEPATAREEKVETQAQRQAEPALDPVAHAEPVVAGESNTPALGEFVADLESSLGQDFLKQVPVPQPAPVAAAPPQPSLSVSVPTPIAAPSVHAPLAASAAAAAAATASPAFPPQIPVAIPESAALVAETPKPQVSPVLPAVAPPAPAASLPFGEEAGIDLAEMFGELKHDLESGVSSADEDPESHYNLGIAFREMGLLDEAIGELQKTCQAVDHGHPFSQIMQTYTWLAQCFIEKGVPEASIRWYEKALAIPTIDEETRIALNYELAAAYETAGDRPSAFRHFMEVYGRNIDYRDVAERIKALKS